MIEFDSYTKRLNEEGWEFDRNIADHVRRKGYSLSQVPFVKAVLRGEIEREDGPLAGMELKHDAYEMIILGGVIDGIIDNNL